jgi:hypothetical protein
MKENKSMFLLLPLLLKEETLIEIRKDMWEETIDHYSKNYCNPDGSPKESNLNGQQFWGLTQVLQRIRKLELTV